MKFPTLSAPETCREMLTTFLGYNANPRIQEGEFAAMENMSAEAFPLLANRNDRGLYAWPESAQGLIAKDGLCYVDGSKFVVNGCAIELHLSQRPEDCPKKLVSMGAYVLIFPDKKYINTLNLTEYGPMEAEYTWEAAVTCTPSTAEGTPLIPSYVQPQEPEDPENMALWLDTASEPNVLLQWSEGTGMWVDVEQTYVTLSAPDIGGAFRQDDAVALGGAPEGVAESSVIWHREQDSIVVSGLVPGQREVTGITVSRKLPEMDYVLECGNRLWGCRYGADRNGQIVNEIYASKLGDFRNWSYFQGTSVDSYTLSLGADGPFTGAIAHMGYPVFFRENCLHKIYGSYPAAFRLQTTPCLGVQRGSGESLAIVGQVLFYKSPFGVCAYDGSLPAEVSENLGKTPYFHAVAGSHGGKYYISMADTGGAYHLFVYDSVRKLWHREDNTRVRCFCSCREELYFLDGEGKIRTVFGSGEPEGAAAWMAETGDLGISSPDNKYVSRLTLRLWLERGAEMTVSVRYDQEEIWYPAARLRGGSFGSVTVPLGVRRCDHLRLRLEGVGQMRLHSLTKTVEQGSDVF